MLRDLRFSFDAIGTTWSINLFDVPRAVQKNFIEQQVFGRINVFDKTYSRFRDDSFVSILSKKKGSFLLPSDSQPLFDMYQKLYKLTNGLFTPLIGNTLSDAGYDAKYSLKPKEIHSPDKWEDVLDYTYPNLVIKKPVLLDFGAAGKGYIVDLIGSLLEEQGIKSYCIDAGGDILYKNVHKKPLRVGLENPVNTKQVIGVCEMVNASICGSAGNRRKWGSFHHILNPKTLQSPHHIEAVWVIAKKTILSDSLSTALFFVEPEVLEKEFMFDFLILYKDFTIKKSKNFSAEIYYN